MIVLLLGRASCLAAGGARTHTAKAHPHPAATPDTLSDPDPHGINPPMSYSPLNEPGLNASALNDQTPKIRIRGLYKRFGTKPVLDGVDLDVPRGTSLVVIGGSGSGKSVLLKCVLGLIEPDDGVIEIDGRDILRLPGNEQEQVRSHIGMLFQAGALFDSLSVWENVAFGLLARRKASRATARAEAEKYLAQVGLAASVGDLSPAELSGGMQKRVALARAIASQPDILFFDEPTTGLDPIMGAVIDGLVVDCVKRLGSTAIAITHDMASAQRIGDQAAMLLDGRICWSGPASRLLDSGNAAVDQFTHGRREGPIQMALRR
jgi:phospholipid/cholesterol/gamma-HCH transport system ATP-binding protein